MRIRQQWRNSPREPGRPETSTDPASLALVVVVAILALLKLGIPRTAAQRSDGGFVATAEKNGPQRKVNRGRMVTHDHCRRLPRRVHLTRFPVPEMILATGGILMAKPTTASEAVLYNATGPKKIKVGNTEIEEFTPAEIIAADRHEKSEVAEGRTHQGVRFVALKHPATG